MCVTFQRPGYAIVIAAVKNGVKLHLFSTEYVVLMVTQIPDRGFVQYPESEL